jgi:hypothetical protein
MHQGGGLERIVISKPLLFILTFYFFADLLISVELLDDLIVHFWFVAIPPVSLDFI